MIEEITDVSPDGKMYDGYVLDDVDDVSSCLIEDYDFIKIPNPNDKDEVQS